MCTLVAIFRVHPDLPLIIAANRDELYARPWSPPARLRQSPLVVAGLDLTQKGTWLGVTRDGFFAAVTNQRTHGEVDPAKRSRGKLALDVLGAGSVDAALALVSRVDAREYNPFNLLFGDARSLHVAYARGEVQAKVEALATGIWVLNNDTIGSRDFPKASRAHDLVAPVATQPWSSLAPKLMTALGDHTLPPESAVPEPEPTARLSRQTLRALQALCVHTPLYGTGSASLLAIAERGVRDYRFAPGPPCVTAFESVTELLGP
jgi:uncharacterized protein with NRDE domain